MKELRLDTPWKEKSYRIGSYKEEQEKEIINDIKDIVNRTSDDSGITAETERVIDNYIINLPGYKVSASKTVPHKEITLKKDGSLEL